MPICTPVYSVDLILLYLGLLINLRCNICLSPMDCNLVLVEFSGLLESVESAVKSAAELELYSNSNSNRGLG